MKRSFLTVVAASLFALGACGGTDTDANIEPVDELGPVPPPAPVPVQPMDTMPMDTTITGDTLTTTTGL
ncbi:MAG: hypothetical protein ACREK1_03390 [Longimicrobiales bacterium]